MKHDEVDLSIIVWSGSMQRELPRTLRSLSAACERVAGAFSAEILVLNHWTRTQVAHAKTEVGNLSIRFVESVDQDSSTTLADALEQVNGRVVGLWCDGANLSSPGIARLALETLDAEQAGVVVAHGFHLGPDLQQRSMLDGYDQTAEDALLATVPWEQDGYRLFDIAVLAPASEEGWFGTLRGTDCMFANKSFWQNLPAAKSLLLKATNGRAHSELWHSVLAACGGRPHIMLGEGTFRQFCAEADARIPVATEAHHLAHAASYVGRLTATSFACGVSEPIDRFRKVHTLHQRPFRLDLAKTALQSIQAGVGKTRYKGLRLAKNPFDLGIYLQVLQILRPASIIEVGTSEGGSAVWMRDQCNAIGLEKTEIVTIDIAPPKLTVSGIEFHKGNALNPDHSFPTGRMASLAHPWLVIEDSAHTFESVSKVLDYFDQHLQSGDMIVVEDGVVADLPEDVYRRWNDGPNHALSEFMKRNGKRYSIDKDFCDFYGHNLTWAPNGWLRKT